MAKQDNETMENTESTAEKPAAVDAATYEAAKPYLKAAMEHLLAAGRSAREAGEYVVERFGDAILPYLHEFGEDVKKGRIEIEGLAQSAKATLFGRHVTREEREQMIRDAAFYRAEQRGFSGGSPEEDWAAAEREVDALLAQETGLVEKGRQTLSSITSLVDKEFASLKQGLTGWMPDKQAAITKAEPPVTEAAKPVAEAAKPAPVKKAVRKKAAVTAKAKTVKKAVAKAAVKKAAVKKTVKKAAKKKSVSKKAAQAKEEKK